MNVIVFQGSKQFCTKTIVIVKDGTAKPALTTTYEQRPLLCGPKFIFNNDHLSTTATIFVSMVVALKFDCICTKSFPLLLR